MKPNIGHPLCAEGIASFIKTVLMLHHGQRVPFLSGQEPMQHYDLAASPFRFTRSDSPTGAAPTVAAINCFADGGTNAHVIVAAWRETEARQVMHQPTAPPVLRRIECGSAKPQSGGELKVSVKLPPRIEQEPALQASRFWERHKRFNSVEKPCAQKSTEVERP
jgi:acyl transferase domain-containing protein